MKPEDAVKIANNQLDALERALAAGHSDGLKAYLLASARLYKYSFGNQLLIYSQSPHASNVAGFVAWKRAKRSVKKGEKGIAIRMPSPFTKEDKNGAEELVMRFKIGYVFDVSQTESIDGTELATVELAQVLGDPGNYLPAMRGLLGTHNISLTYVSALGGADGMSSGGKVTIRTEQTPAQEFSVLVHEFAHELLHHGKESRPSKLVRETEAEAVAYVVSAGIGLEQNNAAVDYIHLYAGDDTTLRGSLVAIQKVSTLILSALLKDNVEEKES